MERNVEKRNNVTVIGTLVENNLEIKQTKKDGKDYIGGSIVVNSTINGEEQSTELRLFAFKLTKDGNQSKLFQSYANLDKFLNKRIRVSGSIDENRFYNDSKGQLVSFNYNSGRFIESAKPTEEDCATFDFSGFVVMPLTERLDKEERPVAYEMIVAQANYNNTKPIFVKLSVDVNNRAAIEGIQRLYETGSTVYVSGNYNIKVVENKVEEQTAFGAPMVKTYVNTFRSYTIVSGSEPIVGKGEYDEAFVRELVAIYKEEGASIEEDAKNSVASGQSTVNNTEPAKSKFGSLL